MRSAPLGPLGRDVPVIGIGTWNMERDDSSQAVASIRRALDLGAAHVDTAELYGHGRVEEIVAEALGGRASEAFLVSKVLPENASRRGTIAACEGSLRRLRAQRIDLYLLHWDGDYPLEDTVAAFEELVDAGKIGAWGVSNFDAEQITELLAIAGPGRVACNQVLYHLGERAIEHAVLPLCEAHGIAVVGYSPFGSGSFPSPRSSGGRALSRVAEAHGATPHQVALAFLIRHPGLFAIPKSSTPARVDENCAAATLVLSDEELASISAAFPLAEPPETLPSI